MLSSRPATAADLEQFYPDMRCSFRAWVAEIDGNPEGIIGIALLRPIACLFSAFNEPLRPYLKTITIGRLRKKAEAAVHASSVPVWAVAEPDEPDAARNLERMGFRQLGEIEGDQVFEWAPSPSN